MRGLFDTGADEEDAALARRASRATGVRVGHRLFEPLSVLHEHVRRAQHPRPGAGHRDGLSSAPVRTCRCGSLPATGDALSIGGNHLIHCLRRNLDVNIVLFNNRIYGLTKGQYSPTSPLGKVTKTTPHGSIDSPLHPLSIAIGCEATFVARSLDVNIQHLGMVLRRAAEHRGTAFVEVYQNCNVFNDNAWEYATSRETKAETIIELEDGKPLVFGRGRSKGIRLRGLEPEVVELGNGVTESDLLVHDERSPEPSLAYLLSRMRHPEFPEPIGVFRAVERPVYDDELNKQLDSARRAKGARNLDELFHAGETWDVS